MTKGNADMADTERAAAERAKPRIADLGELVFAIKGVAAMLYGQGAATQSPTELWELLQAYLAQLQCIVDAASLTQEAPAPGYEKMRGGKPVSFWRDDALEQSAQIAERYGADPWAARDIRAMKSPLPAAPEQQEKPT